MLCRFFCLFSQILSRMRRQYELKYFWGFLREKKFENIEPNLSPNRFYQKKFWSQLKIKFLVSLAFCSDFDFSRFSENLILLFFILDIFKNVHFQKVGLLYFREILTEKILGF